ncbi:MAG: hypothetical protein M5U01_43500 [Ardenticatenaceae bacterium]|nr:hypothetical protein [Ardenticatenaceae bacterium]HBY92575.1 hypothetical protein [Chloroflexota bacterium]
MDGHSADYDLAVLSSMVNHLQDYLEGDRLFKTITVHTPEGERLLKMTIGGILQRLEALHEEPLDPEQADELAELEREFERTRDRNRDLYYKKLGRELKSYMDSWRWFLQNCWDGDHKCIADYPQEVATRLRIESLLEEGSGQPALQEGRQRVHELDERLRANWEPGAFVLPAAQASKYPEDRFWWLYGYPRVNTY